MGKQDVSQQECTIRITTDKPIAVVFAGDFHIGHNRCDYAALREWANAVSETENLYCITMGDYVDNYIDNNSPGGGGHEQICPPALQRKILEWLLLRLQHCLLAYIEGCHDLWSEKSADFSIGERIKEVTKAPFLGSGGRVNLYVNDVLYQIVIRHKFRNNSQDNKTNTVKKMLDKFFDGDIGVVAHHHYPVTETEPDGVYLRTGSFKLEDRYGLQKGYIGHIGCPMVVLNHKIKDITVFHDFWKGLDYFEYLNERC